MKLTEKFREATAVVTTALALHGCANTTSVTPQLQTVHEDTRSDLEKALGKLGATQEGVQKTPANGSRDLIYSVACSTSSIDDSARMFARDKAMESILRYGCPQVFTENKKARFLGFSVSQQAQSGATTCVQATMPTMGIVSCDGKPVDMKAPE